MDTYSEYCKAPSSVNGGFVTDELYKQIGVDPQEMSKLSNSLDDLEKYNKDYTKWKESDGSVPVPAPPKNPYFTYAPPSKERIEQREKMHKSNGTEKNDLNN